MRFPTRRALPVRGNGGYAGAVRKNHRQPFRARGEAAAPARRPNAYIAFTISSTIFFASENSIIVLSRKNSSFSIPA